MSKLSHCFCSQNYSRHREFSDFQPKILMTTMRSFIFKVKHITYTLNVNPVLKRVFHTVLYLGKAWLLSVIYKTMILNQPSRFPSDLHMVQHTVQHNQAPNFIHPVFDHTRQFHFACLVTRQEKEQKTLRAVARLRKEHASRTVAQNLVGFSQDKRKSSTTCW